MNKKMSKITRNIIIVVVIALLAFGIALAVYNHFNSKPINANTQEDNILDDANTGLENLINNILNDENTENEENIENNTETNTQIQGQASSKNDEIDSQTTPGEKKAIELAKEQWKKDGGSLNGVSFNNESIQGDGRYVVSVNNSKTTLVISRYIVDVITGLVEER